MPPGPFFKPYIEGKTMDIREYYVFDPERGWLQDDEKSWGEFGTSQAFTAAELANDIGKRETTDGTFFVMACLGTMD